MHLHIDCVPPKTTSQQKGAFRCGNGIRFFKKAKVKAAEHDLLLLLQAEKMRARSKEDFTDGNAVRVYIKFCYPYLASEKKWVVDGRHQVFINTRPDVDNLVKMVNDCITRLGWWKDDGQVAILRVMKMRGPKPHISIDIERLDEVPLDGE